MRAFGFLSFGHYAPMPGSQTRTAADMLKQTVDLAVGADEIGVNGAYVRVHHFARQAASPMPLLTAMAARTKRIEVGTGVIDMRERMSRLQHSPYRSLSPPCMRSRNASSICVAAGAPAKPFSAT